MPNPQIGTVEEQISEEEEEDSQQKCHSDWFRNTNETINKKWLARSPKHRKEIKHLENAKYPKNGEEEVRC